MLMLYCNSRGTVFTLLSCCEPLAREDYSSCVSLPMFLPDFAIPELQWTTYWPWKIILAVLPCLCFFITLPFLSSCCEPLIGPWGLFPYCFLAYVCSWTCHSWATANRRLVLKITLVVLPCLCFFITLAISFELLWTSDWPMRIIPLVFPCLCLFLNLPFLSCSEPQIGLEDYSCSAALPTFVLRSSGISRKLGALIVKYNQKR